MNNSLYLPIHSRSCVVGMLLRNCRCRKLEASDSEDFARRCGLGVVSESVRRLGELVSRPEATTEEVAELICQDRDFAARLLRAANPSAASEADYTCTTVAGALQRTGMGSALLVAMHAPLRSAVERTFHIMLGLELKLLAPAELPVMGEHILCEISFAGKATGAAACCAKAQILRFGEFENIFQVLHWQGRGCHQQVGCARYDVDSGKVLDRVITRFAGQRRVDSKGAGRDQQVVAICISAHHRLRRHVAARAAPVLNHHGLLEPITQALR